MRGSSNYSTACTWKCLEDTDEAPRGAQRLKTFKLQNSSVKRARRMRKEAHRQQHLLQGLVAVVFFCELSKARHRMCLVVAKCFNTEY